MFVKSTEPAVADLDEAAARAQQGPPPGAAAASARPHLSLIRRCSAAASRAQPEACSDSDAEPKSWPQTKQGYDISEECQ